MANQNAGICHVLPVQSMFEREKYLRDSNMDEPEHSSETRSRSWETKRLKSAFMAATYIVGPSSSVAATAVLTTKTSRCPALPHLPPRLSSPSFGTSLKHSSGTKSFFFFNYFLLCAVKNSWKQCGILYGTGSCISSVRVGGL